MEVAFTSNLLVSSIMVAPGVYHPRPDETCCQQDPLVSVTETTKEARLPYETNRRSRRRAVAFADGKSSVHLIPCKEDLTTEEVGNAYLSPDDQHRIREEVKMWIFLWLNGMLTEDEEEEELRGLEGCTPLGRNEVVQRRRQAIFIVLKQQSDGLDGDRIASTYGEMSVESSRHARLIALADQETALASDRLHNVASSPLSRVMLR